jgi:hypothetical protein
MTLPTNDDITERELPIDQLDSVSGGDLSQGGRGQPFRWPKVPPTGGPIDRLHPGMPTLSQL